MNSKNINFTRFFLLFLFGFLFAIIFTIILPHEVSSRYYEIGEDGKKAGWIYDRIHRDDKNIDIAFLGSSHTMMGIDSEAIDRSLNVVVKNAPTSVNFGMPYAGDNLPYILTKQLLSQRPVKLLVIEVRETPARIPNPMFRNLADTSDILLPVWVLNVNALSDIAFLPRRQIALFFQTLRKVWWPSSTGLGNQNYEGSYWFKEAKTNIRDTAEIREMKRTMEAEKIGAIFPQNLKWIELNFSHEYISRTVTLANTMGVQIKFLYLPSFDAPPRPVDEKFLADLGTIWIPPSNLLDEASNWDDAAHLNRKGASELAEWLVTKISSEMGDTFRSPRKG